MRVLDFVRTIAELSEGSIDIYVNDELMFVAKKGLVFNEKLYRQFFLTGITYEGIATYVTGNLPTTPISEAVVGGKYYADGKILLSCGTMYLVDGFEVKELLSRAQVKEMFNL